MPAEKFFHNDEPNLTVDWGCKHPEHRGRHCDGVLIEGGHVFGPDDVPDLDRLIAALRRARRHMVAAHRAPCVDGSVCGEPAHCPPPESLAVTVNTPAPISAEVVERAADRHKALGGLA